MPHAANGPDNPDALIARLAAEAEGDPNIDACVLAGSRARGDAHPGADVDLYLLLADGAPPCPFTAETLDGLFVERAYLSFDVARDKMARNPMALYTWLDGRALFDRSGRAELLRDEARARFDAFRVPADEKRGVAHWLRSVGVKLAAARAGGDSRRCAYLVATTTHQVFVGLWAANNRPMPSGGGVLSHLARLPLLPPNPAWDRLLLEGDLEQRADAFTSVCTWLVPLLEKQAAGED